MEFNQEAAPFLEQRGQLDAVVQALESQGARVMVLDGSRMNSKQTFFIEARRTLPLDPPVETDNWDAFSDSLFEGLSCCEQHIVIVWHHHETLRNSSPDAYDTARDILTEVSNLLVDPAHTMGTATILRIVLLQPPPS